MTKEELRTAYRQFLAARLTPLDLPTGDYSQVEPAVRHAGWAARIAVMVYVEAVEQLEMETPGEPASDYSPVALR
jgi:hypothetical protein